MIMNHITEKSAPRNTMEVVSRGLARRYRAERRFRFYGLAAIIISLCFLSFLFVDIISKGYSAFLQTYIKLDVHFSPDLIDRHNLPSANYQGLVRASIKQLFPDVRGRQDKRKLYGLVSSGAAFKLRRMVLDDNGLIGQTLPVWVPADDDSRRRH